MIFDLIISKINFFYYVLSCSIVIFVLMLVSVIEQTNLIDENIQLIEENKVLDKKLKSRFSKSLECEQQRKQLYLLSKVNLKLGNSILSQNRQVNMCCPVCYTLKELPGFKLLNPCGHYLCCSVFNWKNTLFTKLLIQCYPRLPNNLCPTCRRFIYEAIQVYPNWSVLFILRLPVNLYW